MWPFCFTFLINFLFPPSPFGGFVQFRGSPLPCPGKLWEAGRSCAKAAGMAAVECLRRDEKHRSPSGDSGPPSSCLGLEQVTVLGNGALFQCQIHGDLAFPEHRRCKAAPRAQHHSPLHVTAHPPGTPPQDGPACAASTAPQSSQAQDLP